MKMSQWLREWQVGGEIPSKENAEFAFWAGWLVGTPTNVSSTLDDKREMAIKCAEFIESQV